MVAPAPPQLREALRWAETVLADAGVASPAADAALLAADLLDVSPGAMRAAALAGRATPPGFAEAVARRAQREPVQHITGRAAFRELDLAVGPGVFVPRPETESVAGAAIEAARRALALRASDAVGAPPEVLVVDLCTGSGAIALAIATELPEARVVAVELDRAAHEWATRNLATSPVRLVRGDARTALPELDGRCDVVVANPPYIPTGARPRDAEVRDFDPPVALYGLGQDGLAVPRGIIAAAGRLLRGQGVFIMEHGDEQGAQVRREVAATGQFAEIVTERDLTGRERFVRAVRRPRPSAADEVTDTQRAEIARVRDAVRDGALVVLPTDTVYGIGADPTSADAVARLLAAKGRGETQPSPVLVAGPGELAALGIEVDERLRRLLSEFWPGALTIVAATTSGIAANLGALSDTIAVRMPAHPLALAALRVTGPLAVTSANLTGMPPATTCAQARDYFGDTVAVYLDGGATPGVRPSTIVDVTGETWRALRVGALEPARLVAAGFPMEGAG